MSDSGTAANPSHGIMRMLAVQRMGWKLTRWGWLVVVLAPIVSITMWCSLAEPFFCESSKVPADILVVEAWVGTEALRAAAEEFRRGHYRIIVVTGGYSDDRWSMRRSSFAEMAKKELIGIGIADDRILAAQARDSHSQRTHAAAAAAWQTLRESGERPQNVNLFTFGPHARRSRLVFARTAPAAAQTGVISWCPPEYQDGHWWQSSERGEDLIKESVALTLEFLNFAGWLCPYGTVPQEVEPHRSQVAQSPM